MWYNIGDIAAYDDKPEMMQVQDFCLVRLRRFSINREKMDAIVALGMLYMQLAVHAHAWGST